LKERIAIQFLTKLKRYGGERLLVTLDICSNSAESRVKRVSGVTFGSEKSFRLRELGRGICPVVEVSEVERSFEQGVCATFVGFKPRGAERHQDNQEQTYCRG
jgi:hypothetical protein